ncbi:MAG: ABC transporter ATP-binding protein [Gammaproteobacteria bacterium RIFCSPHIGHO2_12_FULL_42_10]|nr:MAG: ABC transporter ATP-binding protein [Gammaproteobacteria bacterium RIFCSPHIGHO2_12_FULL_42_10]
MTPIIDVSHLKIKKGGHWVHNDLNLTVNRGEILGIVGGSGCGKTTLLRAMIALTKPDSGTISIFNENLFKVSAEKLLAVQCRFGVLFQENALFSSLNLLENISFPLCEHTLLDKQSIERLALLKIVMTGLLPKTAAQYPAELSGGMLRRAGLARALALDPELLFLDEPTAGLDPVTATGFDELLLTLKHSMNLTVVIVTHDLDTLWTITDRVAFLGEGRVLCVDKMSQLVTHPHPLIQVFFSGPRGRRAEDGQKH